METSLNNIYLLINTTLNDPSFIDKHRLSDTAFIRNRSLNFSTLILYLLNFRKHSNQVELDQFFKTIIGDVIGDVPRLERYGNQWG